MQQVNETNVQPVDVLAVLRDVLRIARAASNGVTGNTPRIAAGADAICAVAELIEAAEDFRGCTAGDESGADGWAACKRLDAALARCGGTP